jgi:hypothetical protein
VEAAEGFIGGFAGGLLMQGLTTAYGVYATTKRIIGVKLTQATAPSFLGGAMAGFVQGQLMPKLSPEESVRVIRELDQKKEFDLTRDQIAKIELKNAGMIYPGHIIFTSKTGQNFKVSVRAKVAFERLRDVMLAFSPELVKLK